MVGKIISHYRIIEKLGEGGMGVVYRAEDTRLKRTVALKFLPQGLETQDDERARFFQEAQAASALNHPNVCTIYDIAEGEAGQFIAMEFVDGVTLRQKITAGGLEPGIATGYAVQIAEALEEAHSKGIVHRDIKSENIMVNTKNQVKVMDFGLAKLKGSLRLTKATTTVGTLGYMAPEQLQGGDVDARSDIFSFGVLVYELLTGRMPFRGEHEAAMMYSILNEDPVPLTTVRPDLDPELERIVHRALEKDPEDRYQRVDDIRRELLRLQKKTGRVTRPVSADILAHAGSSPATPTRPGSVEPQSEPAVKPARRLLYGAITLVALISLVAVYFLFFARGESIRSIAVLPFVNQSGNAELEFLSDGFTEALINRLSRLPGVTMMSRSSVFRYKGKDIDPAEAGTALGVQAVLTGRILQHDNRISVAVELVNVRDHSHIWGDQYQRSSADVLALQDEITQEISHQLRVTLTGKEEKLLAQAPTRNSDAYELYLKGRFHWNKRSREGFESAISCFHQAIEKDPGFALAYVGLAECYSVMSVYYMLPPSEASARARTAVKKALDLDPALPEALVIMAVLSSEYDWEWEKGVESYKRALELNPNYATAHQWYGETLAAMGRVDEAIAQLRKAQELDPLSPIIATSLGTAYAWVSRYDEARKQLAKALELDPTFPRALWTRGIVQFVDGDTAGAVKEMRGLLGSATEDDDARATLAFMLGRSGNMQEAASLTRGLHQEAERRYVSPYFFAVCYAGMGNNDESFRWLEKGFQERSSGIVYMRGDPLLAPLHRDPRFNKILMRMGLAPTVG
jgi:eukaryotic-like serine/threonine-protein kinase